MDDKEIVSAICATLADKVGKDRFDMWFGGACRFTLRDETVLVELPSRFCQDWVRSHFRGEIESACAEAIAKPLAVEFRVDATLVRSSAGSNNAKPAGIENRPDAGGHFCATIGAATQASSPDDPIQNAPRALSGGNHRGSGKLTHAADAQSSDTSSLAHSEPVLLGLNAKPGANRRKFSTLEGFVVGASNRLAHASAQMVAEQLGRMSPLLVYGPTGVGKTHLLEGIWSATRKTRPDVHAVYLSAEQFTTHYVDAVRCGTGLPSFRRKYRGMELLIVDGLQFFAGKDATVNELLHTTDTLLREGRQVVFAADRAASELRHLGEGLVTRLSSGLTCAIDPPDYPTRLGIVRKLADSRGMNLSDEVAEFVATHLTSHARELSGALNRLEAAARMLDKPITRSLAEESLAEMIRHTMRAVRLADIDKAVCEVLGLQTDSLQAGGRGKEVSQPRMLAMWLARKHTRSALAEIGRHFGRRSHSTVISAEKKIGSLIANQSTLDLAGRRWKVEETLRRIEERLRLA